jgi:hypothetical protein
MQLLVEGIIINYKGIQALNHDPYGSNIGGNDPIATKLLSGMGEYDYDCR